MKLPKSHQILLLTKIRLSMRKTINLNVINFENVDANVKVKVW